MIFVPRTFRMIRLGVVHMLLAAACCFTVFPFCGWLSAPLKQRQRLWQQMPSFPQRPNMEITWK